MATKKKTTSKTKSAYTPAMADEAVKAKTGKDWKGWFTALDKAKAQTLTHKEIAKHLTDNFDISGWWAQTVTVEYERARGLRAVHQTTKGFSVSVTKTIATTVSKLYAATTNAAQRAKWFPAGTFEVSSQTRNKYVNASWNDTARLAFGFTSKGAGKAQIAIGIEKLEKKAEVEKQRTVWKKALTDLVTLLEG